jgi:hypothetical protein
MKERFVLEEKLRKAEEMKYSGRDEASDRKKRSTKIGSVDKQIHKERLTKLTKEVSE